MVKINNPKLSDKLFYKNKLEAQGYKFSLEIIPNSESENIDGWNQQIQVKVYSKTGETVGMTCFQVNEDSKKLFPNLVSVERDYQRKGIATAMYTWAESQTGTIITKPDDQSDDAELFWNQKNRLFGRLP